MGATRSAVAWLADLADESSHAWLDPLPPSVPGQAEGALIRLDAPTRPTQASGGSSADRATHHAARLSTKTAAASQTTSNLTLAAAAAPTYTPPTFAWADLDLAYGGYFLRTSFTDSGYSCAVNAVKIDLAQAQLVSTGRVAPGWVDGVSETRTATVTQFINTSPAGSGKVAVAINADSFGPFNAATATPYTVNLTHYAMANGVVVSNPNTDGTAATLAWNGTTGSATILTTGTQSATAPGAGTTCAVSGFFFVLDGGVVTSSTSTAKVARSAVGLSQDGKFLYLVTVENSGQSKGATFAQLGQELKNLGAYQGICLDGDTTSQMAYWNSTSGAAQMIGGLSNASMLVGQHLGILPANNIKVGTSNNDTLTGSTGADVLSGFGGNDTINGGDGNDAIYGGAGLDALTGGVGADRFGFTTTPSAANNSDLITDFVSGTDKLALSKTVFTGFTSSATTVTSTQFRSGAGVSTANTTAQRLIYDTTARSLYYDSDGSGNKALPIQIASFSPLTGGASPLIVAADFLLIA